MGLIRKFKVRGIPLIDGIVATGRDKYAIALRKTNGNILLDKDNMQFTSRIPIPFVRGIISLVEYFMLEAKMLKYSAEYFDNENKDSNDIEILSKEEWLNKQDALKAENTQRWLAFSGILFLIFAVILGFFILPVITGSIFFDNFRDENWMKFNIIRSISSIIIFIGCLGIFKLCGGNFKKIRQYNCALNKAINCFESDNELSLENVKNSSSLHPCSIFYILFLAVIIFNVLLIFIKMNNFFLTLLIRVLLLLLSIGLSYEISNLLGMFNGKISKIIAMFCGIWTEIFTFSQPDDIQIYIAITAVKNAMVED